MPSSEPTPLDPTHPPPHPSFREALKVWTMIGLLSFGGPTGQIGLMHRELVEKRQWVSDGRFLHALNYCMLLPGPEAQQLAIYIGWLLHRIRGGLLAGLLFVLPGALLMWGISCIYVVYGNVPLINAIFHGLKPAVMAIVAAAVLRLGRKALKNPALWSVSAAAFVAIRFFDVPFPAIVLTAGLLGWTGGHLWPRLFDITVNHAAPGDSEGKGYVVTDSLSGIIGHPTVGRTARTALIWTALWAAPVAVAAAWLGADHVVTREGWFFSKAALVTFGGAYAVLPYVAQQAVETHGWLSAAQMMDGLGLAETTPGPLILVLQFVGFLGGWYATGNLSPLLTATLGAALTSWVTFVPGFLFIFAGAPWVESTRGNLSLNSALSAVTAAVVGVILNLAVWFGWHVVLPASGRIDGLALMAAVIFFVGLQWFKWKVPAVIGAGAVLGLAFLL